MSCSNENTRMAGERTVTHDVPIDTDRLPERVRADDRTLRREEIFEILSNERRRLVLEYLREHDEVERIDFRALVDQVAAWENETTTDRLNSSDRKCVYTALRQTHLPKLQGFGLVEFDHNRGHVEPTDVTSDLYPYMDFLPERERFWSGFYLSISIVSVLFALFVWIGTLPFWNLSGIAFAVVAAIAFSLSSAVTHPDFPTITVRRTKKG